MRAAIPCGGEARYCLGMDRRTLLLSSLGLAVTPPPQGVNLSLLASQDLGTGVAGTPSVDAAFDAWREGFIAKAVAKGLPEDRVRAELGPLTPDAHVIALDHRQPELTKPISSYLATATSASNIAKGQANLAAQQQAIVAISDQSGVPGEIMVAVWGMESAYGAVQGSDDVLRSMATLAADGRRRAL